MTAMDGMERNWAVRWQALFFVALLGLVFSANYTNHGPLVGTLIKTLDINLALAGFLTTAIFATHGLLQIPGGALAERWGAKNVATFGLVVIAVCNLAAGFASSYTYLILCKLLCGIGTGCAFIGGLRYVPTFFHGKEIERAKGIYGGSILLGSGFVIFGIPQILQAVGWRAVFFCTGGMAVLLLVAWIRFAPATQASGQVTRIRWGQLLGNGDLWLLSFAQLASFGTAVAAGVWVNTLLTKSLEVGPKSAGAIGAMVLLLGIATRPLGGILLGRKLITQKQIIVMACTGLGLSYFLLAAAHTLSLAVVAIILAGLMAGLPFAAIFNYARECAPANAGVAMGFVNFWGAVAVMAFPPIIGRLVDVSGSFVTGFYLLGAVTLLSAGACSMLGVRSRARIPQPQFGIH